MTKKTFTLIIIVTLIIIGVAGWYFFFRTSSSAIPGSENNQQNPFPFGEGGNVVGTSTQTQNPGQTSTSTTIDLSGGSRDDNAPAPRLRHISLVPTAGAVTFDVGSTTMVRYIERATGHIYETASAASAENKISNITIPKVHEALWSGDGSRLLVRYLKDDNQTIRTFYAKISTTTTPERAIEGLFLSDGIRDVSVSGNRMFYFNETNGGTQGIVANIDGSSKLSIFTSSFTDWMPVWSSANAITIYSKPSGLSTGSAYLLNPSTGAYSLVASDINGLTALGNSDASMIIYSGATRGSVGTAVYDVKSGTTGAVGVSTLADKCVWSKKVKTVVYCAVPRAIPNGTYPDDWYKGKVSFDDSLWKIDTSTGVTQDILDPEFESGESIDMTNLSLDQNETVILFTNKKDMTVWQFTLTE